MPSELPVKPLVVVPGMRSALTADYRREAQVIDPRLVIEVENTAERMLFNVGAPHCVAMNRMADRLKDGELLAVEARRIRYLLAALDEPIPWLSDPYLDPRTGVIVGTDDSVRLAVRGTPVYW
jgi:hypothetical protein